MLWYVEGFLMPRGWPYPFLCWLFGPHENAGWCTQIVVFIDGCCGRGQRWLVLRRNIAELEISGRGSHFVGVPKRITFRYDAFTG